MSWLREHYDMYIEDSVSNDSADVTMDIEDLSCHRGFGGRSLRSAHFNQRTPWRTCAGPSHCDIVMTTQQSFADLSPGGGASSDASGAPGDADSPPPQATLAPPPPPQQHASLAALAALPQNGSIDGASSSGDSCDGTTQVTTAVVVSAGDDDDAANNGQGLTSPTIVGSHHYITVAVTKHDTVWHMFHAALVEEGDTRSYASLAPVATTVVTDGDAVGVGTDGQGVHPTTYVQYVESGPDQAIYATSNGQMAYPVYTVGETSTMYTAPAGQYYSGNSAPVTYTPASGTLGQAGSSHILAQSATGGAYIIQSTVEPEPTHILGTHRTSPQTVGAVSDGGGVSYIVSGSNSSSLDEDGQPNLLSHATRVSPATVQWLLENYETAEGVSLPRSTLYNHYLRHCNEHTLDPVNAASFGKLIRSVFLGLRTRRLGTRGNSKYHYYGIRVKPGSQLTHVSEEGGHGNRNSQAGAAGNKKIKYSPGQKVDNQYGSEPTNNHTAQQTQNHNHHQYLGDGTRAIPDFPEIMFPVGEELPDECNLEDVDTFRSIYREHCEAFLDAVLNMEFVTVESLWREFWRSQDNNNGDECEEEKYLSKTKLYQLCRCGPVQQFVRHVDYLFYQNLVEVLIPEVLRPIPSTLTQAIRNFAKGLESWLTGAMAGCPEDMMHIKVSAVSAFAQTLRRYTSLNHLAQAARAVLQNASQINQMLADLNRVDFHNVQEQASWVCECGDGVVQQLEADFKATLQQQNSLEQWAEWLTSVVTRVLRPFEGRSNFSSAARQFLLKWSFYSSMVIRDLTLRSAASFGSFHLIRLLYDEYMFYLVEHRIAKATGETPIAVIGEKFHNSSSLPEYQQTCNGGSDLEGKDVKMVAVLPSTTILPSTTVGTSVLQLSGNKRLKMS